MRLSNNFTRKEFACKCGCGFDTVDTGLIFLCELVREFNESRPTIISSGCRCKGHNSAVGGSPTSQHLVGRAADLIVNDPKGVYEKLTYRFKKAPMFGFGCYATEGFIHVDSRELAARWTN